MVTLTSFVCSLFVTSPTSRLLLQQRKTCNLLFGRPETKIGTCQFCSLLFLIQSFWLMLQEKKSMHRKKVQGSIIVWTNESQFSFSFFFANQVCSIPVLSVRVNYLVVMEIGHCWLLKQVVVMVIMACGQPSMFFFFYFEWECHSSS